MRTLSGTAQTAAEANLGEEPLTLLKVEWASGTQWYAPRDLAFHSAKGSIIRIGSLTAQAKQTGSGAVGEMSFGLSDVGGDLKALIDTCCPEGTKASVYQAFASSLTDADLILIHRGVIVSPEWSEGQRTLSFSIETKVKDQEVGFAIEQGDYDDLQPDEPLLTDECIGRAWPLCFGSNAHQPALKLLAPPETQLNSDFKTDEGSFDVEDASKFPDTTPIDVIIDGMVFRVTVDRQNNRMHVAEANVPKYEGVPFAARESGDADAANPWVAWISQDVSLANTFIYFTAPNGNATYHRVIRQSGRKIWLDNRKVQKKANGSTFDTGYAVVPQPLEPPTVISQVARNGREGWGIEMSYVGAATLGSASHLTIGGFRDTVQIISGINWNFPAGQSVRLWSNPAGSAQHPVKYVVNLIACSQIKAVYAWRRHRDGKRSFVAVPPSYYVANLGESVFGQTAATVTLKQPLSEYYGQGWEDTIYASHKSSIGPNVANVIKWLLETYSDLDVDSDSFDAVEAACANYPVAIHLDQKRDVVQLCEEIAWKARCALTIEDGVAKLKYLSIEPTPSLTLDEDFIDNKSIVLANTRIEDVSTHFRAFWKKDGSGRPGTERVITKTENVTKFGLIKREFNFDIYNVESLVNKSATFWAHRYANAWRKAKFNVLERTAHAYEMNDCLTLDLDVVGVTVKGLIEAHSFDPEDEPIAGTGHPETTFGVSLWLPWLAGTRIQDPNAWMSDAGDALPNDPVDAVGTTDLDDQWADDLSQSYVNYRIASHPAKVVNESADHLGFNVDIYDDGYEDEAGDDLPPTNKDAAGNRIPFVAYPIDLAPALDKFFPPSAGSIAGLEKYRNILKAGTKIQIFNAHGARWFFNVPASNSHVPAKINGPPEDALGRIGVTIYPDGYDGAATETEVKVYYVGDASDATIGDEGLLIQAGELKFFFPKGGSGSGSKVFKLLVNNEDGSYYGQQYDRPNGTPSGPDDVFLIENNFSEFVPADEVDGKFVDGNIRSDGNYYFNYDAGPC